MPTYPSPLDILHQAYVLRTEVRFSPEHIAAYLHAPLKTVRISLKLAALYTPRPDPIQCDELVAYVRKVKEELGGVSPAERYLEIQIELQLQRQG